MSRAGEGEENSDLSLMIDAAGGDTAAWLELWPRLRTVALGQAYVWLGSGPEAVTAVVEAMAELLDQADLGELDPEVPLQAEVAAATRDHAIDMLQARQADGIGPPEQAAPPPRGLSAAEEDTLLDALSALPRRERESLWLVGALGLHPEDAAAVMADGSDGVVVTNASDRAAEALQAGWASAMADGPKAATDPVTLLPLLVPEGPPAAALWDRIDRHRSGLDLTEDADDRVALALVPGAAVAGAASDIWDDEPGDALVDPDEDTPMPAGTGEDDTERVPLFAPVSLDAIDTEVPRPPDYDKPRRRLLVPLLLAFVLIIAAVVAAASLLRKPDHELVNTEPPATTTTSTTLEIPTTTIPPVTTVASPPPTAAPNSIAPVTPATATTTTVKPTTTTARPTTTTTLPVYASFDELSAAGVAVDTDEVSAMTQLINKFGAPSKDAILSDWGPPCTGGPIKGARRVVTWPGLNVAFINHKLEFWQLVPGRSDLAIPGNIRIDSSIGQVRNAGYDVNTATLSFAKDPTPGDAFVIEGHLDSGSNTGKVNEMSNWDHCGPSPFA